ncbi:MAG: glycosyl transferase [Monoraphidium minutum]|nr:MAG: glycosyl transferase [Monoraphidium minutum]
MARRGAAVAAAAAARLDAPGAAAVAAAAAAAPGAPRPGRYSIIVPTYNEAENIPLLVSLLHEVCSREGLDYEVVVVDDASPDGTADVVRALQAVYGCERLRLAVRPGKLGLGSAYAHGLSAATGSWVILMDADLSHHPRYIPALVAAAAASGADVVAASRYLPGGGVAGWGAGRKLTSRGANVLARVLLGLTPSDLTGAFRLYRRPVLEALLGRCVCRGYAFQMEMMARAAAAGAVVAEVPIVFVDRLYGTSKLGAHEFTQFLVGLARLMLEL